MTTANRTHGFTLFELLIVMTLISILALIAIPSYKGFKIRTHVSLGVNFIQPLRYADESEFISGGLWPQDLETGGIPHDNQLPSYIKSIMIAYDDGSKTITITYNIGSLGDNNTLIFYTTSDANSNWYCDRGSLANTFRPKECKI